jgi:hypothetical protein
MQVTYRDLWHNGEETLISIFSWLGVQVSQIECSTILRECQIANLRGGRLEGAPWEMATKPKEFYRKGGDQKLAERINPAGSVSRRVLGARPDDRVRICRRLSTENYLSSDYCKPFAVCDRLAADRPPIQARGLFEQ